MYRTFEASRTVARTVGLLVLAVAVWAMVAPAPASAWKMTVENNCKKPAGWTGYYTETVWAITGIWGGERFGNRVDNLGPGDKYTWDTGWKCPLAIDRGSKFYYCSDLGALIPCCWDVTWEFTGTSNMYDCKLRRK